MTSERLLEVSDTTCGACLVPVIHGPEQCIVMQMYVSTGPDEAA